MPACPAGHESSATDFCDTCGMRIDGQPPGSAPAASATGGSAQPCPQCGADRAGQFCEVCGFDFAAGSPSRPTSAAAPSSPGAAPAIPATSTEAGAVQASGTGSAWTAMVTADRAYFESVVAAGGPDAASIEFPRYCPERQFRLSGAEIRIGRRSVSRGLEPEIDLTGPPTDPGISHLHAVLIAQPDGTWSVLDPGSSNGTQVNGNDLATGMPVPLSDGDRVCVGAWTMLTIHRG